MVPSRTPFAVKIGFVRVNPNQVAHPTTKGSFSALGIRTKANVSQLETQKITFAVRRNPWKDATI